MLIEHVLNTKKIKGLHTVKENDLVSLAVKLLADNKIGALPVTNDGKNIEGVISERDIVKHISSIGPTALETAVKDIMTRDVISCTKSDSLRDIIEQMNSGRFRHMPVVEDKELIEFISISDLVLAHLNELEYENQFMRGSVTGKT